jgi:hypothetical protein
VRVLVTGWFSLHGGGATAGDVMARDVACAWLAERRIAHDVAQERALGPGVDWFRIAPERYSHLLFICGPVGADAGVAEMLERFAGCRRIALNVSVVGDPARRPFDVLIERDGRGGGRPDLALAAPLRRAPVVARVEIPGRQPEYADAAPDVAHAAFDRLLAGREAAVVRVDTRLDPALPGRRSAAEVEALFGVADVVLTTRLHGIVLALRQGIPALAIDVVPGGAKLLAQARALGWPAAVAVDALDDAELERHLDWCLGEQARELARSTAARLAGDVGEVRAALERALG